MSATEVTVSMGNTSETVPVNQIEGITFDDEPVTLRAVRSDVAGGRYDQALAVIDKIDVSQVGRAEIQQEIEFYKVFGTARAALAGEGEIAEAAKQVAAFLAAAPNNYHFFEAGETAGELAMAVGQFAKARECYETVGKKAPWTEYRMRAAVGVGKALLGEKKIEEALKFFEGALAMKGEVDLTEPYRRTATLGKARCLAETKQFDQGVRLAEGVIAQADPEDATLLAEAYNAKGIALVKAGRNQEALYAFLHVETLYAADPQAHAETLFWLVRVWGDLKNPQRALEARRALGEQYPESRFSQELKARK
jgi:tetratricopeptide (TPR) repeat protein